jgi:hypothetical protein
MFFLFWELRIGNLESINLDRLKKKDWSTNKTCIVCSWGHVRNQWEGGKTQNCWDHSVRMTPALASFFLHGALELTETCFIHLMRSFPKPISDAVIREIRSKLHNLLKNVRPGNSNYPSHSTPSQYIIIYSPCCLLLPILAPLEHRILLNMLHLSGNVST